jgi:hypothetical protein
MTDNIFLFCDLPHTNHFPLEKYLDHLLARLPEEKRKILAPNGVKDTPYEYVQSHSIFCRFKKTCTCEKVQGYGPAQFVLSDRRPVQPYTQIMAWSIDDGWSGHNASIMDGSAWVRGFPWGAGHFWTRNVGFTTNFTPIWRQTWDTVTVTEHEHSERGATLWQPIGNGMYEWAHVGSSGRVITGLGRMEWDAEGNGRLFRVTEH